jgi:hypothetical protein
MSRALHLKQIHPTPKGAWLFEVDARCCLIPKSQDASAPLAQIREELQLLSDVREEVANMPPLVPPVARAATIVWTGITDAMVRTHGNRRAALVQVMLHPQLLDDVALARIYGDELSGVDLFALARHGLHQVLPPDQNKGMAVVPIQVPVVNSLTFLASAISWLCEQYSESFTVGRPIRYR